MSRQVKLFNDFEQLDLGFNIEKSSRGNPNFSSKWNGLPTRAIRLPIAFHDKAVEFCRSLLGMPKPVKNEMIHPLALLSDEDRQFIRDAKIEYGEKVADKLLDQLLAEVQPQPQQEKPCNAIVTELSVNEIRCDPVRFQYKILRSSKTGSTGSLKSVTQFNPDLAGLILVWLDPKDGLTYVINGHNRLDLANRLNVEKVSVRYIKAVSAKEARLIGAMANIGEGKGTVIDAAKIFRDTNSDKDFLATFGIQLSDRLACDGLAIANLNDVLFNKTVTGELRESEAIALGKVDQSLQFEMWELIKKDKRKLTSEVLTELADIVNSSVSVETHQSSLFGDTVETQNLALQKSELNAYVTKRLKRDKYLFSIVSKSRNANELQRGNNAIDTLASSEIADHAKTAIALFNQFKNQSGELCKRINDAAIALLNSNNPNKIKADLYDWVIEQLTTKNLLQLAI